MRTNIEIDDQLMADAQAAGNFKTKKEAVEAGLLLIAQQAAARELLKLEGKLSWGWGDEDRLDGKPNWSTVPVPGDVAVGAPKAKAKAKVVRSGARK